MHLYLSLCLQPLRGLSVEDSWQDPPWLLLLLLPLHGSSSNLGTSNLAGGHVSFPDAEHKPSLITMSIYNVSLFSLRPVPDTRIAQLYFLQTHKCSLSHHMG
jgi:hypothetical protein